MKVAASARMRSGILRIGLGTLHVFAFAIGLAATSRGAQTPVCGTISSNTVWTAGNVYVVNNCAVVVPSGITLTIPAGTVVKFAGSRDVLFVQGTLLAQGTAGAPIAFTSLRDDSHAGDTNGDGTSVGQPGDWSAVRFAAGSTGRLTYAFVGYGGSGAYDHNGRYTAAELESFSSDVMLDHVTLRSSGTSGCYGDNVSVQVTHGQVNDNVAYGLYWNGVGASVPLTISDTTFSGNGTGAGWLHFRDATGTVTFERNAATGPKNGFRADGRLNGGSLTWNNEDDLPLLINGGLTVAPSTTLTLASGTIAKFGDARDVLVVQGTLTATATALAPIILTSLSDDTHGGDTNGDGASEGRPGQWSALRFAPGSTGRLGYVSVSFGGSGAYDYDGRYTAAELEGFSSDVTLDHVSLRSSGNSGLYGDNASVRVDYAQVNDNTTYGLYWNGVDASVPLVVSDSTFSGNGTAAGWLHFRNAAGTVTFERNAASGPKNGFVADGRLNGGSLTWNNDDDLPLLISGGLTVAAATTLTLEPGTVVKFADGRDVLQVEGTLDALGTAGDWISFTSSSDDARGGDTNGDGPSQGQPGQWSSLRFAAGSTAQLAYAFVGYGGSGAYDYVGRYTQGMVESFSSDVTLDHCTLHASGIDGLYVENVSVAVTNGTVSSNTRYGLNYNGVDALVPLVVTGNVFSGSQGGAARLDLRGNPPQITFQGNSGSGSFRRGFSLGGTLSSSAVWDNTGSLPLVIEGGLTVAAGATLTVQPGTVVKFAGPRDVLLVQGALTAVGSDAAPIAFTSLRDDEYGGDTNGDGPGVGAGGDWSQIRFAAGSTGRLVHAFLGYGGSGVYDHAGAYGRAILESFSSDVILDHCTLHASAQNGLYAGNASVVVTGSELTDNHDNGLRYNGIDPGTPLMLRDNTFAGNGAYGAWVYIANSAATVTAENNQSVAPKNGLRVSGGLTQGTLDWDSPSAPMVIDGGLAVRAGSMLTLEPGTVVKFAGGRDVLEVAGTLSAEGTFTAPIAFTSISDDAHGGDTNGDGPSTGSRGQWAGLRFLSGGVASLRHSFVGYGGSGAYDHLGWYGAGLIDVRGAALRAEYGALRGSASRGLYAENAEVEIRYASITDHAQNGIANATPAVSIDASYNWWGDPSGPKHAVLNPTGAGSVVSDGVDFQPWLDRVTWLEPTSKFLHGVAMLSWTAFDVDPGTVTAAAEVLGATTSHDLGRSLPASGEVEWDTLQAPDGAFELRAGWRDAVGGLLGEDVRTVVVNNDPTIAWHGGRLRADETWDAGHVHVVNDDVIVSDGVHLLIQPGAIVKFAPGTRIIVEDGAVVDAPATETEPIILTSIADDASGDTNLDGAASGPHPGDWGGFVTSGAGQVNDNDFVEIRYAQSTHSGMLSANEQWNGSLVHHVTGDVTIPNGAELTIDAGAVVKFDAHLGIVLQPGGRLVAQGTVAQPIVLTSSRDDTAGGDTNGDGTHTEPQAGDWRWIYVDNAAASFDHVELRYGGGTSSGSWDYTGMIRTTPGAEVTFANSILRDAFFEGVLAWAGGTVTVTGSVIAGCDRGVNSDGAAVVRIINSTLDDNRIGLWGHSGRLEVSNTIISNSLDAGIDNVLSSPLTLRYSDVWSALGSNYVRMADQTGLNGNVSADPRFKDRERGNYRLDYASPAIDAADGPAAPEMDLAGSPRYDDPRTPNTGIAASDGAFADMGAYEFVETAESDVDLVVTSVVGPTAANAGEKVTLEWTVTNTGTGVAVGPWHDAISLLYSPDSAPVEVPVGEVLAATDTVLGPGQSHTMRAEVVVPGSVVGPHYWEVTVNVRGEVFEGRYSDNNSMRSLSACALDLAELVVDGPAISGQFSDMVDAQWFKITPLAGASVGVALDMSGPAVPELFARYGSPPSGEAYDTRSSERNGVRASLLLSDTSPDTYYILARPQRASAFPAAFTIAARTADFQLVSVAPNRGGNGGAVTLTVTGEALPEDASVRLITAGGAQLTPRSQHRVDAAKLIATFDLTGVPVGLADVVVSDAAGAARSLTKGFEIIAGGQPDFWFAITGPERLRAGRQASFELRWGNRGTLDAPMHLIDVVLPANVDISLLPETPPLTERLLLLTATRDSLEATIPSGYSDRRTLYVTPHLISEVALDGGAVAINDPQLTTTAVDWTTLGPTIRPADMTDEEWAAFWTQFTSQMGSTWFDMLQVLAGDAVVLNRTSSDGGSTEGSSGGIPVLEALLTEISAAIRALGWSEWEDAQAATAEPAAAVQSAAGAGGETRAPQTRPAGQTYGLIATGQYYSGATAESNLWRNLENHQQVSDFLTKTTQVPETNIQQLTYDRPRAGDDGSGRFTRENFVAAIDQLAKNKRSGDTLFVYLNGHGLKNQFEIPDGTFIDYMADIYAKLNKSNAGKIVVVVDACHSGSFTDSLKKMPNVDPKKWNVFVACDAEDTSKGQASDHGTTFTYRFFKGELLKGGSWYDAKQKLGRIWTPSFPPRSQVPQWFGDPDTTTSPLSDRLGKVKHGVSKGVTDDCKNAGGKAAAALGIDAAASSSSDCPPGSTRAPFRAPVVGSSDPNEKQTVGVGSRGYTSGTTPILYTIYFENDPHHGATAPVQEVLITDQLSAHLDWSSLQLSTIGVGDQRVSVPAGRDSFTALTSLPNDAYPLLIEVALDRDTGVLTWHMASRDPVTQELPEDPLAGFLPVNDSTGKGQGFVTFAVQPVPDLSQGTVIRNRATITFDPTYGVNPPIETNEVLNTIGTPAVCVGDCAGTGVVAVNNLITIVNIALGSLPVGACDAGDQNEDGKITVSEIVTAVNNALNGCPVEKTPTPTRATMSVLQMRSTTPTPTPTPPTAADREVTP
jgi:hypothetical protein